MFISIVMSMTVVTKLNPQLQTNLLSFPDLDPSSFPLAFIKYQNIERVLRDLPMEIQTIACEMVSLFGSVSSDYRILIDYKVRDLKKGETGCPIPGWHLDYTENPNNILPIEEHLIFTTHVGTEFITTPMDVEENDIHFSMVLKRNSVYNFIAAEPNSVTKYSRLNLHRCPIMFKDCRRLVMRISKIYNK